MGRIKALLLGVCAALVLGMPAARAGAWQFVETSCQPAPGFSAPLACSEVNTNPFAPTPIMLPKVVATFSSPDQTGSYYYNDIPPGPPSESGDQNFTFEWFDTFEPLAAPVPSAEFGICGCEYDITWNGPPIDVLTAHTFDIPTSVDLSGGIGTIGSEALMAGCGGNASEYGPACIISGYWDPVGIPEASSVTLLAVLLTLTGAGCVWLERAKT